MRVKPDRVHRWTPRGQRPLVPYYLEGGLKCFSPAVVERFIRESYFRSGGGVTSGYPDCRFTEFVDYPPGIPMMWLREFCEWSGMTREKIGRCVRCGDIPFFEFGGIRLFDPALILQAREARTVMPIVGAEHQRRAGKPKRAQRKQQAP